jgi:hypothetical protein
MAALAALAAGGCGSSRHAAAEPPRLENPVYQRELRKLMSDGSSGAVAIVATDAGTWRGAAGWADASTKRRARTGYRFQGFPGRVPTYPRPWLSWLRRPRRLAAQVTALSRL